MHTQREKERERGKEKREGERERERLLHLPAYRSRYTCLYILVSQDINEVH